MGAELVDPRIRQFSDLPGWLAANKSRLARRTIMMYCTGGVRCERASALLKELLVEGEDVLQLQGMSGLSLAHEAGRYVRF